MTDFASSKEIPIVKFSLFYHTTLQFIYKSFKYYIFHIIKMAVNKLFSCLPIEILVDENGILNLSERDKYYNIAGSVCN